MKPSAPLARLARAWAVFLLVVASLLLPRVGSAQEATELPNDVGEWTGGELELPAPPADFVTERRGRVTWTYPRAATDEVRELEEDQPSDFESLAADLGKDIDETLVIRVGTNPEQMAELAPIGHPPPGYAVGVAYPSAGIILLTLTAPEDWKRPAVAQVLRHEMSHVAVHRAVGGRPLPRWFVEGVAIYQAGEYNLARQQTLWEATVSGNLVPLDRLSSRFPSRPNQVGIAYAEAADFVGFLRHGPEDAKRFRGTLHRIRDGLAFDVAIEDAYYVSLGYLEREWRASLNERYRALPLVVTGGGLWVFATMLIVFGYFRRRRDKATTLARWEREEAAVTRAEQVAAARLAMSDDPVVLFVPHDTATGREPGVPTVEHDGRSYTLH